MGFIVAAKGAWWILNFILRRREEMLKARKRGLVVVVTGGTSGLGLAIVRAVCMRLSKIQTQGSHTVIMTSRSQAKGMMALKLVRHPSVRVGFHQLDLLEEDSVRSFSEGLKARFGQIDLLLNNAGLSPQAPTLASREEAEAMLNVNFHGTKAFIAALLPLLADGGRVLTAVSGLAEVAIRWMSEETYSRMFSLASSEGAGPAELEAVVRRFGEELSAEGWEGGGQMQAAMAYPFTQAARIALTQTLGSKATEPSSPSDQARTLTFCSFSPGWCRSPAGGPRAPFSPLEGAEEAVFAAFDAKDSEIQGAFLVGRKPARFGDRCSFVERQLGAAPTAAAESKQIAAEPLVGSVAS
ncbi:hypothetical protein Efla_005891 [Eimeria flavescens]